MSFASYYVEQRSAKNSVFYNQVNTIIDWNKVDQVISRYYRKGETLQGARPYSGVLLFKMLCWVSGTTYQMSKQNPMSMTRFQQCVFVVWIWKMPCLIIVH